MFKELGVPRSKKTVWPRVMLAQEGARRQAACEVESTRGVLVHRLWYSPSAWRLN